jgi:hypothetical protein
MARRPTAASGDSAFVRKVAARFRSPWIAHSVADGFHASSRKRHARRDSAVMVKLRHRLRSQEHVISSFARIP